MDFWKDRGLSHSVPTEHLVDVPVPQKRVQQRSNDQFMDVPFPQIMKEIVEQFKIVPQEQFSERISEQIVEVCSAGGRP